MEGFVEVRLTGLDRALRSLTEDRTSKMGDALLEGLARAAARRASELAPRRTGLLASSVSHRRAGRMRYSVVAGAAYAVYLELGVRPFPLHRPVPIEGVGFRYVSVHPGIAPRRFLQRGLREALGRLGEVLRSVGRERAL